MILADEPTAALDKDTGRQVVDEICRYAKKAGCTVLMVTHDIRILEVADRVLTMVDGSVTSDVSVSESPDIMQLHKQQPVY
jgi:putative ABC transport system ATP-binding protein